MSKLHIRTRITRHGSRAMRLLTEIGAWLDDVDFGLRHPGLVMCNSLAGAKYYRAERARFWQAKELQRLAQRRLVHIRKEADGIRVALTAKGIFEWYRQRVLDCEPFNDDRYLCMVVFDIPESQRALRLRLRRFLRDAGFTQLQRSVWISPFDAERALQQFFKAAGARKWVRVLTAVERQ